MSADLYKEVQFNDGEGVTFGDLNDAQNFLSARLSDQLFEKIIGSPTNQDPEFGSQKGADASTAWAYCLSIGGANPKQGSANNKVKIGAGTLFQKIASADGNKSQLLAYTFPGTDEVTLTNGDGANPRADLIQMKLEYESIDSQTRDFQDATTHVVTSTSMLKKSHIKCTISVKVGTPAASPTYPIPDAGNVPIAAVIVGTSYVGAAGLFYIDTAGAVAVLHDLRMPLRIRPQVVRPPEFMYDGTAEQALTMVVPAIMARDTFAAHTAQADHYQLSGSSNPIDYPIPLPQGSRLIGYTLYVRKRTNGAATITAEVWKTDDTSGAASAVALSQTTNNGNATGYVTMAIGLGIILAAGNQYYLKFTGSGSIVTDPDEIYHLGVTYTLPQNWMKQGQGRQLACTNNTSPTTAFAPCRQSLGRVIGVSILASNGGGSTFLTGLSDNGTDRHLNTLSALVSGGAASHIKGSMSAYIDGNQLFAAGPTVLGNGTHYPPVWSNGKRCIDEGFSLGSGTQSELDTIAVEFPASVGLAVYSVTFYIAEGL